jgi:predicted NAD-dependent protein-ADP-ribosyltransferase YbiA (DUF1768 family)
MDTVLYHKFTQHYGLKRELLATGDAELIEVRFSFWAHPLARLTKLLIELGQRFVLGVRGRWEGEKRAWEGTGAFAKPFAR